MGDSKLRNGQLPTVPRLGFLAGADAAKMWIDMMEYWKDDDAPGFAQLLFLVKDEIHEPQEGQRTAADVLLAQKDCSAPGRRRR